jgi:sn-glycerol 3-phosphate transport system substrate-binding protein
MLRKLLITVCLIALSAIALPAHAATPVTITVWIAFTNQRLDWLKARATDFNKQFPQYNVTVEGYSSYEDILKAADLSFQQKSTPDIVHYFEVGSQKARDTGYFKPISDALNGRTSVNGVPVEFDDFIPVVLNYYKANDKLTSMPWNTSTAIMFSNPDMMKAAGIDKQPATWADLETDCAKIMALTPKPDGCVTFPNYGWFIEQWIAMQGQLLVNNENGRSARATETLLDSPTMINTVTWIQKLYNEKYYYYTGKQRDWDGSEGAFSAGKVAFLISSSGDATDIIKAASDNKVNVITAGMPYNQDTGNAGNIIGGGSLWLIKDLPQDREDGALTFLLWLDNPRNAADWHKASGYVPIRQGAIKLLEDEGWFKTNPNYKTASDVLSASKVSTATSGAVFGTFPTLRDIVTGTLENLMLNGGDPAAAMQKAKQGADKDLADYNALFGQ